MTYNEIRIALKVCGSEGVPCEHCPYFNVYKFPHCITIMCNDALSLIHRQQETIEKVQIQIVRNRLQSIPLPMPVATWLREELTEHCNNRCMEEL